MASNDTLFNFEDTLGDRDDMFSPRTPSSDPIATAASAQALSSDPTSTNSSIYESRSTKDLIGRSVHNTEESVNYSNPQRSTDPTHVDVEKHNSDMLTWEQLPSAVAELLSPDQPKTFSEDTCIDLAGGTSSDLSLTFDGTFTATLDDRTCILVGAASPKFDRDITVADLLSEHDDMTFDVASETVIIESGSTEQDQQEDMEAEEQEVVVVLYKYCFQFEVMMLTVWVYRLYQRIQKTATVQ